MDIRATISQILPHLSKDLVDEISTHAIIKTIPKGVEILRVGQYVKVIPIVQSGLIKVFSKHDDKELLLYYIQPNESCIMSFASGIKNDPSRVFAITDEDTTVILLPTDKVMKWTKQSPDFNSIFFQQYNVRYIELLETINHVIFDKMDKRLYDYLVEKSNVTANNPIKISHRQIASELGTAREVISRVMKKLENEQKVKQHSSSIEIL